MVNAMLVAIPVFFITIFVEWAYSRWKGEKYYRFADAITNLNLGAGNVAINLFVKIMAFGVYAWVYENFRFMTLETTLFTGLIFLVVYDFMYYWAHRWSHEVNFLWAAHVVHHQSEDFNLSVALRQPWFHTLLQFMMFIPLAFFGFHVYLFGAIGIFITLYQYWIHTKAIKKLPRWLEFVFNTPSHHRVHHARDPKYIDRNHAAFLIIWDRIFGTFKEEEEEPTYGITTQFASWNPVWANFHYWVEMYQIAKQSPRWHDWFTIWFRRPGWRPEELGGYQAPPEFNKAEAAKSKFETRFSLNRKIYVIAQYALLTWGIVAYTNHFETLTPFYKWSLLGLIVLTTLISGAIMENKKWVVYAEHARLVLAAFIINSLYYLWYVEWFTWMLAFSLVLLAVFNVWFRYDWFKANLIPVLSKNK